MGSRGEVAVQSIKGRMRLCWSHAGQRYFLSLGLPDTKLNKVTAQLIATRITEDIRTDNFDPTLAKYRPEKEKRKLEIVSVFDRYKATKVDAARQTRQKFDATSSRLAEFFGTETELSVDRAAKFLDWWVEEKGIKIVTLRDRLATLVAAWEWAIHHRLVQSNPWADARKGVRKSSKPKPKPFTADEVSRIINLFKENPHLDHYSDFVEFKLATGLRTGEICALQWRHLSADCRLVTISESYTKGEWLPTKTGEVREFRLSTQMQNLLLVRKKQNTKPEDLVFMSIQGCPINANNFARYYWRKALDELGITYRRPYNTRATFVSHALEHISPGEVCDITGHSRQVMFNNYAGKIKQSELPEMF